MTDLTIILLTANRVPDKWAAYHKEKLLEAVGDIPIITVSKKPMWGINILQDEEFSVRQVYQSLLKGCLAATTPYIAVVEDDTLYHKSHFEFRPPLDTYAFEGHRWGLFTWGKPIFYWSDRISNGAMIAPRQLVIDALTERFDKYPENNIGELGKEKGTTIDRRKTMIFYSDYAMIFLSHSGSLDPLETNRRKARGKVQAYRIPYWGEAEEVVKKYQ